RDPDLGKVVLYQLSYFRVSQGVFVVCDAKVGTIFELTKSFCRFFLLYVAGYLWKSGVNLLNELVLKG
ncbi:hypothetical protein, partial [Muribaculum intestinale]